MSIFSGSYQPARSRVHALLRLAVQWATPVGLAVLAFSATAQTANPPPTLKQALDAAWQLSGLSRSEASRRGELTAKDRAANSWLSGEPIAGIAHRTDRLSRNDGFREYEADIELPLWNPGVRVATQAAIAAQRATFDSQIAVAKLKLAGQLRALAANAAAAQVDLELNQRRLMEASALAQDMNRRVKAGENARVDSLQADVQVQLAKAAIAQAQSQQLRLQTQWRSISGLATVAVLEEVPLNLTADASTAGLVSQDHPALRHAKAEFGSAHTKLALAQADQRDAMSLGVGIGREQSSFGAAGDTRLRLALRIPLGGNNRNAPRLAAAAADLDATQAEADAVALQLAADLSAASADLRAAQSARTSAQERLRLSTEVKALITKSWQLGDSDLPTRLRADNEQFDAKLSLAKANIDVQRAIAQLNQANGVLP